MNRSGIASRTLSWISAIAQMAETEGFEPSIELYNPITV